MSGREDCQLCRHNTFNTPAVLVAIRERTVSTAVKTISPPSLWPSERGLSALPSQHLQYPRRPCGHQREDCQHCRHNTFNTPAVLVAIRERTVSTAVTTPSISPPSLWASERGLSALPSQHLQYPRRPCGHQREDCQHCRHNTFHTPAVLVGIRERTVSTAVTTISPPSLCPSERGLSALPSQQYPSRPCGHQREDCQHCRHSNTPAVLVAVRERN